MSANPRRPIDRLPEAHSLALRLDAAGVGPEDIASRLGIERAGVPALLQVARAKLSRAEQDEEGK